MATATSGSLPRVRRCTPGRLPRRSAADSAAARVRTRWMSIVGTELTVVHERRAWPRIGRAAAAVSVVTYLIVLRWHRSLMWTMYDLEVYRAAGRAASPGANIYQQTFGTLRLPFTYPPFAALLFA